MHLWTDDDGQTHEVVQGEGGEQGDPLMPALFALGMHDGLREAKARLLPNEHVFAYLDDVYVVTSRARARAAFDCVTSAIEAHAGIRTNLGKLQAWCRAGGPQPPGLSDLGPSVWKANAPAAENGLKVLGTPSAPRSSSTR